MDIERIDTSEIEAERNERERLVAELIEHRAVPTALPGWTESYPVTSAAGAAIGLLGVVALLTGSTFALPVLGTLWVLYCGLFGLIERSERHERRTLAGSHAGRLDAFRKDTEKHLSDVAAFNREVSALKNPDIVLSPELRETLVASLSADRAHLIEARQRLFKDGFDAPFRPCIEEIEASSRPSRHDRREQRRLQDTLLLHAIIRDAQHRAGAERFIEQQKKIAPELPPIDESDDDLEARFAALEATERDA